MTKIFINRSERLLQEFKNFKIRVEINNRELTQSQLFQFTLKKRKKTWVVQHLNEYSELDITFCKTANTMLKRLSYLQSNDKLSFAQDIENSSEFHVKLKQIRNKKREVKQLQLSL